MAGLLGGLGHCLGMCGPLVALAGIRLRDERAARASVRDADPPRFVIVPTVTYHAARIAVYAVLGAVAGAVGSLLGLAGGMTNLAGFVGLAVGLTVVVIGLGYAGLLPGVAREQGSRWWNATASWALRRPGLLGASLLGAVNGLLPCGLVYGALLVAAGTGSPARGALGMAVFGVATFPALAIVQTGMGALGPTLRRWLLRAAGVVVTLIGVQLCLRGLAALGVVPSVHIGGLMLW